MSEETFKHGDGCCGCNCTNGEIGTGGCLFTFCCPCFAFCQAADESNLNHGPLYCLMTICGFGCCAVMMLGQDIEDKRNLRKHGGGWLSFVPRTLFSVVNECKVYAKEGAVGGAPAAVEMERK
ncbi:hypothetical protein ACHAW6_009911 [Cyclotella cf. meneghiniana]